jgi:hypothetical protein
MTKRDITIALVSLMVGGIFFYVIAANNTKETVTVLRPQENQIEVKDQGSLRDVTIQSDPVRPEIKTYTSHRLGIQFSYISTMPGGVTPSLVPAPTEDGNTIQFVSTIIEFTKIPDDSLVEAIEKRFERQLDSSYCVVKSIDTNTSEYNDIPYTAAVIEFKQGPQGPNSALFDKCPSPFTQGAIGSRFFYDADYPNRFYYYSGGYSVDALAPNGKDMWSTTIRIIPTSEERS